MVVYHFLSRANQNARLQTKCSDMKETSGSMMRSFIVFGVCVNNLRFIVCFKEVLNSQPITLPKSPVWLRLFNETTRGGYNQTM